MVQDRRIVSIKLNGDIAGHLEWPLTSPNHPNFYIFRCLSYLCTGWT